jgi:hypothetical protein
MRTLFDGERSSLAEALERTAGSLLEQGGQQLMDSTERRTEADDEEEYESDYRKRERRY